MAGVLRSVVKMIKDLCPPFLHGIPCDNDALDILKIASIENYKKNIRYKNIIKVLSMVICGLTLVLMFALVRE